MLTPFVNLTSWHAAIPFLIPLFLPTASATSDILLDVHSGTPVHLLYLSVVIGGWGWIFRAGSHTHSRLRYRYHQAIPIPSEPTTLQTPQPTHVFIPIVRIRWIRRPRSPFRHHQFGIYSRLRWRYGIH